MIDPALFGPPAKSSNNSDPLAAVIGAMMSGIKTVAEYNNSHDKGPVVIIRGTDTAPEAQKLVIPPSMNLLMAIHTLEKQYASEEKVVDVFQTINGIPADCLVGFWKSMQAKFGFVAVDDTAGFFGPQPPVMVNIPIDANGGVYSVPFGKLAPPCLEGGSLEIRMAGPKAINIVGELKNKFQPVLADVVKEATRLAQEESIYKGKAVKLDLSYFMLRPEMFKVMEHSPQFFTPANKTKDDLILNKATEFKISSSIYSRLEAWEKLKKHGISFKHGVLLAGPFGTGKSLAATVISKMAVDNGVTFMILKSPHFLVQAIEMTRGKGRVVLFCEDCDALFDGEVRSDQVNEILNTLDGADSKEGLDLMLVLTTNNPDKISPACMRPGRIDQLIELDHPDEETIGRFLLSIAGKYNHCISTETANNPEVVKTFAGKSPAFIESIVSETFTDAVSHSTNGDIDPGCVEPQALLFSAEGRKDHEARARSKAPSELEKLRDAVKTVTNTVRDVMHEM
jgi:transitional endoplasmic reticulum ATPase